MLFSFPAANAAVTASFSSGTLSLFGDSADDTIVVSRNVVTDEILLNGAVLVVDGVVPTGATVNALLVHGLDGNDTIQLDASLGAIGIVQLYGEAGNDVIIGGIGADIIDGGLGVDLLQGGAGDDNLLGGPGDDIIDGQAGDDSYEGDAGSDTLIWHYPGSETMDGGDGDDTAILHGFDSTTQKGDQISVDRDDTVTGTFVVATWANLAEDAVRLRHVERLSINGLAGGDSIVAAETGLAGLVALTFDGGEGNDLLIGGDGNDVLRGGEGNDIIAAEAGDDVIDGGAGNDVCDPGTGTDTVIACERVGTLPVGRIRGGP